MSLATAELPTDPAELRTFALACQSELKVAEISVQYKSKRLVSPSWSCLDGVSPKVRAFGVNRR